MFPKQSLIWVTYIYNIDYITYLYLYIIIVHMLTIHVTAYVTCHSLEWHKWRCVKYIAYLSLRRGSHSKLCIYVRCTTINQRRQSVTDTPSWQRNDVPRIVNALYSAIIVQGGLEPFQLWVHNPYLWKTIFVLTWKIYWFDRFSILHMPQQYSCRGMCKSVIRSDK